MKQEIIRQFAWIGNWCLVEQRATNGVWPFVMRWGKKQAIQFDMGDPIGDVTLNVDPVACERTLTRAIKSKVLVQLLHLLGYTEVKSIQARRWDGIE